MKNLYFLLLTLLICSTSCNNDDSNEFGGISAEEQEVELKFTSPVTYASGQNPEDVAEMDLVVCKGGVYQYTRQAYKSDIYDVFRSILKIEDGVDIHFFANCRAMLNASSLFVEGANWEADIQPNLLLNSTDTIINGKKVVPMWGRIFGVDIKDNKVNSFTGIKLLRSVASVNICFQAEPEKGLKFKPEVAYIYYGPDKAFTATVEENLYLNSIQQIDSVKTAITPTSASIFDKEKTKVVLDANTYAFINSLYMFENDEKEGRKRTRLVVGGKIDDSEELTYYPFDFQYKGQFLTIARNHRYNLNVTSVNSEGFPDPDVAAENASVNLDYEVIEWNEYNDSNIGIDGPDYLSISSKKVILYRDLGSVAKISLNGTFTQEKIDFSFGSPSVNGVEHRLTDGDTGRLISIGNSRFNVRITGESTNLTLTFLALGGYNETNPASNKDVLIIQAGRIKFEVQIEQITSKGWDNGGSEEIEF